MTSPRHDRRLWCSLRVALGSAGLSIALALMLAEVRAQTQNSYPMLMSLRPVAVQVGQVTECEASARYNLYGAYKVLVSGEGVTGDVVQPEKKEGEKPPEKKPNVAKTTLRFTAAADAVPGPRDFRVITPQGASTVGQLVVVRDPITRETGDNNTAAKAQMISLPATVCGAIEAAEDVDCFKFKLDQPTALTFCVRSQLLENRIHDLQEHVDPIITLRGATGSTLATNDNYYAGDPLLHYQFDQPGEYVLEIRDVRYKGNPEWVYAIEANSRPFVTQVVPLSVAPGVESKLSLVGFNLPADATGTLTIPASAPPGLRWVGPIVGGQPVNAVAVYVAASPVVIKAAVEPAPTTGQGGGASAAAPTGQPIAVPSIVAGRIEKPADADRFTFEAKAGQQLTFEVIARRAQSELDCYLRILNDKGAAVSEADDLTSGRVMHQDSLIENWTAPADGKYTAEVRDLHQRGGPQYTYALSVTPSQPYYTLEVDTDKTLLAPGVKAPFYVKVVRKNGFAGEVQLAVDGLPAGVTAVCGKILAGGADGCIILEAAPDAPVGAANLRITGTATHSVKDAPALQLTAVAMVMQEYYSPGGGRGHYPVEMHTACVAEPMDVRSVKLSTNAVTLKPGESQKIDVTIERAPDMKQNVTLDVLYQHLEQHFGNSLPKGVTVDVGASKTLLTGEETKGHITLKAAADAAAVDKQLVPLMAHVSVNFVMKMTYCEPLVITVTSAAK
jgi:hypothetical protein